MLTIYLIAETKLNIMLIQAETVEIVLISDLTLWFLQKEPNDGL